jgi:tetratricopeptide (TPR) repeat protein
MENSHLPAFLTANTQFCSIRRKNEKLERSSVIDVDLANIPKPALALYNKAVELRNAGDHVGAIEQLNAAIAAHEDFMLAYNEMGVQYLAIGEFEKADSTLQTAVKKDPKAYMPRMNRGIVLYTMKRYAEAEPLLRTVLDMKDGDPIPHYFLGHTLAYLGKFDEAERELQASVKLGGDKMKEAHRLLAIIYGSRGDIKSEIVELEAYLRLAPTAPDAEQLRQLINKLKNSH